MYNSFLSKLVRNIQNKKIYRSILYLGIFITTLTFLINILQVSVYRSSWNLPEVKIPQANVEFDNLKNLNVLESNVEPITQEVSQINYQSPQPDAKIQGSTSEVKYGFYLTSENNLNGLQFKITKTDNSISDVTSIIPPDVAMGEEETDGSFRLSNLYLYPEGLTSIAWSNPNNVEFEIHYINNPADSDAQIFTTGGIVEDYEKEYEKRLFNALGFNIITRTEWGAPVDSAWIPEVVPVNRIIVHHTATSVDMASPARTVKAIYDYHKYICSNNVGTYPNDCTIDNTWSDIGYNYLIDPYGTVYEGRTGGNGVIGAHSPPKFRNYWDWCSWRFFKLFTI